MRIRFVISFRTSVHKSVICHCLLGLFLLPGAAFAAEPDSPADTAQAAREQAGRKLFREHVRGILIHHCLECHGGRSTKADFDLSSSEALRASGLLGETPQDSYLLELVRHESEPFMPFKKPKLSKDDADRLARWIDLGAPYDGPLVQESALAPDAATVTDADRRFWSFRRLSAVEIPELTQDDWCRTAIDRFIGSRLEAVGLSPNPVADRRTLIRRATFDLTGLPPTPAEVQTFLAETDPRSYETLIERLLASPHYGERWARHWLDVARFAESHGYEQDYDRPNAYHYRDFVIQALNRDLPYDEFVRWQIAGDELEPENPLAWMATGFLGAGVFPTQLTEAEFESARYDELDDMTATTGVAFLGLTIGCARCHDHKYDPIPTADYYRLAAFFGRAIRSEIELDLAPDLNRQIRERFAQKLAKKREQLSHLRTEIPQRFERWLATSSDQPVSGRWMVLTGSHVASTATTRFELQPDNSWFATGDVPQKETLTIVASLPQDTLQSVRLEALTDPRLPHDGPGRAANGNFALGQFQVRLIRSTDESNAAATGGTALELSAPRATHEQNSGSLSIAASIDDDPISGWAVDGGGIGRDQAAVFDFQTPLQVQAGDRLAVTMTFHHPNGQHTLGRFRLSVTPDAQAPAELGHLGPPASRIRVLQELRQSRAPQNSPHWHRALQWFEKTQQDVTALRDAIAQLQEEGPQLQLSKVLVCSEGLPHLPHNADGRGYPHFYPEVYRLQRGDVHQKQEPAEPGLLQVLTPSGSEPTAWAVEPPPDWERTTFRRAALAQWLTDADHGAGHLLARVIVNRVWQHHFGRGLVATPNDFGLQGERPTHPALLEWLAYDFVTHGWKLKRLHKQILLSHVFMQNSAAAEQKLVVDRENTLWWRRTPRRLEAETIRDAMLAVSGVLDTRMYGPGSLDPHMRRRSIYFFIKRSQLIPMMMLFDWPEHLVSIGRRATTTTAPQALAFLNSPEGTTYARAFAERLQSPSWEAAVDQAFWLAFSRAPEPRERRAALGFLRDQAALYESKDTPGAEKMALQDFCRALFAMNEFIYID